MRINFTRIVYNARNKCERDTASVSPWAPGTTLTVDERRHRSEPLSDMAVSAASVSTDIVSLSLLSIVSDDDISVGFRP